MHVGVCKSISTHSLMSFLIQTKNTCTAATFPELSNILEQVIMNRKSGNGTPLTFTYLRGRGRWCGEERHCCSCALRSKVCKEHSYGNILPLCVQ